MQLLAVGDPQTAEWPYYVMNYVEKSLKDMLRDHAAPLPTKTALTIFTKLVEAMTFAHNRRQGLVQCDLKPGNVLINEQDNPLVTDFGQSRLAEEAAATLGTEGYMPPDQADVGNEQPDKRWDVYALGAIGYAMLTGDHQPPRAETVQKELSSSAKKNWRTETHLKKYRESLAKAEVDWDKLPREVDRAFRNVLARCLAVDPAERYHDAGDVLDALRERKRDQKRKPIIRLGIVATLLSVVVAIGLASYFYIKTVEESQASLTDEIVNGQLDLARVAAESLESRFRERGIFLKNEATSKASEPAREALAAAIKKFRTQRSVPPPHVWNRKDREATLEWVEGVTRRGEARQFFVKNGLTVLINADKRAYGFASMKVREGENKAAPWAREDPWEDDDYVRNGGINFAFRNYFNGRLTKHNARAEANHQDETYNPVEKTHISTVYRSIGLRSERPWCVEVVQPLWAADPDDSKKEMVVGIMTCNIEVRDDLVNWLKVDQREYNKLKSLVWVIDGNGNLVWRPEINDIVPDDRQDVPNYEAAVTQLTRANPTGTMTLLDPWDGRKPKPDDKNYKEMIAVAKPFHPLPTGDGNAWHVVVAKPKEEALKPVHSLSRHLINMAVGAATVFVTLASILWFSVYRMLRHISTVE